MRKLLFILVLLVIAIVFGVFMWNQIKKQPPVSVTRSTQIPSPTVTSTPVIKGEGTSVVVGPGIVNAEVNNDVLLEIQLEKLGGPMLAADVVVMFDPQYLEYTGVTEVNTGYDNPRKRLIADGKLLLSFIKKPSQQEIVNGFATELMMGILQFRAVKPGETIVRPEFDGSNKSSMVYLDGANDNQLTTVTGSDIVIK